MDTEKSTVLRGKTALFIGDSICAASVYDHTPRYGYAGRIADLYGLAGWVNRGLDGWALSNVTPYGQIIDQLKAEEGHVYDFIVMEGHANDAWFEGKIGAVSDIVPEKATEADFADTQDTLCGGLEREFCYLKKAFPFAKPIYIITGKMDSYHGNLNKNIDEYVAAVRAVCEKWGIPCLDFNELGKEFYGESMEKYFAECIGDVDRKSLVHPNAAGYDRMAPIIAEFMIKNA